MAKGEGGGGGRGVRVALRDDSIGIGNLPRSPYEAMQFSATSLTSIFGAQRNNLDPAPSI